MLKHWRPVSEEAEALNASLKSFIRHKMYQWHRHTLNSDVDDDILNTAWMKALESPDFHAGTFPVRDKFLKTTAVRHMMNSLRAEQQREEGLKRNWDRLIINCSAIQELDCEWAYLSVESDTALNWCGTISYSYGGAYKDGYGIEIAVAESFTSQVSKIVKTKGGRTDERIDFGSWRSRYWGGRNRHHNENRRIQPEKTRSTGGLRRFRRKS